MSVRVVLIALLSLLGAHVVSASTYRIILNPFCVAVSSEEHVQVAVAAAWRRANMRQPQRAHVASSVLVRQSCGADE